MIFTSRHFHCEFFMKIRSLLFVFGKTDKTFLGTVLQGTRQRI